MPANPFAERGVARNSSQRHTLPRYHSSSPGSGSGNSSPTSGGSVSSGKYRLFYQVCFILVLGLSAISVISLILPGNQIQAKLELLTQGDPRNGGGGISSQSRLRAALAFTMDKTVGEGGGSGENIANSSKEEKVVTSKDADKKGDEWEDPNDTEEEEDEEEEEKSETSKQDLDHQGQETPQKIISEAKEAAKEEIDNEHEAIKDQAFGRTAEEEELDEFDRENANETLPEGKLLVSKSREADKKEELKAASDESESTSS